MPVKKTVKRGEAHKTQWHMLEDPHIIPAPPLKGEHLQAVCRSITHHCSKISMYATETNTKSLSSVRRAPTFSLQFTSNLQQEEEHVCNGHKHTFIQSSSSVRRDSSHPFTAHSRLTAGKGACAQWTRMPRPVAIDDDACACSGAMCIQWWACIHVLKL
eukprot:1151820-Pelagomonas_calceolata.AAC.1